MQREHLGETVIRLEEFSLAPADAVTIWLEAKDGKPCRRTGCGSFAERTLTLASEITRRRDRIVELEQLLDTSACHLGRSPREAPAEAATRRRLVVACPHRVPISASWALLANVGDHPVPERCPCSST